MASWAAVLALSGFHYSAVSATMTFTAMTKAGQMAWSNGSAWGICRQTPFDKGVRVELEVKFGEIALQNLVLTGLGSVHLGETRVIKAGQTFQSALDG
jgi:hypothetical protein